MLRKLFRSNAALRRAFSKTEGGVLTTNHPSALDTPPNADKIEKHSPGELPPINTGWASVGDMYQYIMEGGDLSSFVETRRKQYPNWLPHFDPTSK